jgi:hypothetical protein
VPVADGSAILAAHHTLVHTEVLTMMRMMTRSPLQQHRDSQTGEWTLLQRLEKNNDFWRRRRV